jgi:trimeric autotransporter adhesin
MKKYLIPTALSLIVAATIVQPFTAQAKSVDWNRLEDLNLEYYWSNGSGNSTGYAPAINDANVTVNYVANVYNADTGTLINDGATIPVGTKIRFEPKAYEDSDISWFGTGQSWDSPNGRWISGGAAPSTGCVNEDFVNTAEFDGSHSGPDANVYIPLSINPPSNSVSVTGSSATLTSLGSGIYRVDSAGTINGSVVFAATTGKFYYRYYSLRNGDGCMYDNRPLSYVYDTGTQTCQWLPYAPPACDSLGLGICTPERPAGVYCNPVMARADYTLSVPEKSVSFTLSAVSPNGPPTIPTISGPVSGNSNTGYNYSFTSTDPDGDQIQYHIDWNMDGVVDQGNPYGTAYNSGQSLDVIGMSWATDGTKQFQARAQDVNGNTSGWRSYTVTITTPPPTPTALLTANPSTIRGGQSSTLTYSCSNGTSASINNGVGALTPATGGTVSVAPSATTAYTLTCSNVSGTATDSTTVTVGLPDLTSSLVSGHGTLTVVAGQTLSLDANVANLGAVPTGVPFITTFWTNTSQSRSGGTATEFTSGYPGGFPASYSEVDGPQLPVTRVFSTPGTYYYQACANRNSSLTESIPQSNTGNDCSAWGTIIVTAPPAADLTAGVVAPTVATVGVPVTLTATASNTGNASSGSFPVLFDFGGLPNKESAYISGLASGGSGVASVSYTFTTAGSFQVRACANNNISWTNVVTESNYGNNCGTPTTITVSAAVPPPSAALSASPASIVSGNASTLTYSCSNATSASINQGVGTVSTAGGTRSVSPTSNTTYVITCTNSVGSATATTSIAVQPLYVDLTAGLVTPTSATAGTAVTLSANAINGGNTTSGSFPVLFQIETPASSHESSYVAAIAAGGSRVASVSHTFASAGTYRVRACANKNAAGTNVVTESDYGNNCGNWTTVTVSAATPPPTATISASPTSIVAGNWSTLTHSCTNATSATINSGVGTVSASNGSLGVSPSTTTTYTITCTNSVGSDTASATVTVTPALADLTAGLVSPTTATAGVAVTLSATASNVGNGTSGSFPVLFQVQSPASLTNSLYLAAIAPGGSRTATVSHTFTTAGTYQVRACANQNTAGTNIVTESNYGNNCGNWTTVTVAAVVPQPTATLSASPTSIVAGNASTLTHSCTNATSASISGGVGTVSALSGTASVSPVTTTTYTLSCTNSAGTATDTASITVIAAQADLTAGLVSPTTATAGTPVTLSATASNIGNTTSGSFPMLFQVQTPSTLKNSTYLAGIPAGSTGSATVSHTFASAGSYQVRACANQNTSQVNIVTESNYANNCGAWTTITVAAAIPAPTATLSASPASIVAGNTSTLTHSCTNAASASINQGVGTVSTAGGTRSVSPSSTTTYTLTCTNTTGTATSTATVTVAAAQADLTAGTAGSPTAITATVPTTISAQISNVGNTTTGAGFTNLFQRATNASGAGAVDMNTAAMTTLASGANGTSNITYTFPSAGTWYIRACADKSSAASTGAITESNESNNCGTWAPVTVAAAPSAPTASLTASRSSIATGEWSVLSHSCTNSTSASISAGVGTVPATNGTVGVSPASTTTYTLTCSNVIGSATSSVTVAVTAAQADLTSGSVTPTSATAGTPVTLSATVTNVGTATSGSFPVLFQVESPAELKESNYINGLAASSSNSGTVSHTFPVAGPYKVRACANYNSSWTAVATEGNYANNCGAWTTINVTNGGGALSGTCSVSPSTIATGGSATWSAAATGGNGTYTYTWSGSDSLSGSGSSVTKTYTTQGTKTGSVVISDGVDSKTITCSNSLTVSPTASTPRTACTVSPSTLPATGGSVTYNANPTGGASGPYAWIPSNASSFTTTGVSTTRTFTSADAGQQYGMNVSAAETGSTSSCPLVKVGTIACTGSAAGTINAAPNRVQPGDTTTLTVNVTNTGIAPSCTVTGPGLSQVITPTTGACTVGSTITTPAITAQTTYRLTCGTMEIDTVTVNVVPKFNEY